MFPLFPAPLIHISSQKSLETLLMHAPDPPFTLISSPFAGCSLGIPWWLALLRNMHHQPSILDCGASIALALQALHSGISGVVCRHAPPPIQTQWGSRFLLKRPSTCEVKDIIL